MKKNEKYVWQGLAVAAHFFAKSKDRPPEFSSHSWRTQFEKSFPHPQAQRTTETIASDLLGAFAQAGIITKKNSGYTINQWPTVSSIDDLVKAYMVKKNPGRHINKVTPLPSIDAKTLAPHSLKKVLKGCDVTQGSLAKMLGVKRVQVSRWLNNIDPMPLGVEARIKRALGLDAPATRNANHG